MLGPDHPFELKWVSVYTFRCQRMERFRHGRVFFVGDAAHQVSPFGARGANSGIQDADNLAWKLALVLEGLASDTLLDSYDAERIPAADENILNSTRSTDFITPKSAVSRTFRDATLQLAGRYPFARKLVNSGRLSLPHTYLHSPLDTLDHDSFARPRDARGARARCPAGWPGRVGLAAGPARRLDSWRCTTGTGIGRHRRVCRRPEEQPLAVEPIIVCPPQHAARGPARRRCDVRRRRRPIPAALRRHAGMPVSVPSRSASDRALATCGSRRSPRRGLARGWSTRGAQAA